MMRKLFGYRIFLSGLLVVAIPLATIPSVALAQTSSGISYTGGTQYGNGLESLVMDTTGAVAAAYIACNKTKIQSKIKSLFADQAESNLSDLADTYALSADSSNSSSGVSIPKDQLVHFSSTNSASKNLSIIAAATQAQADKEDCTNTVLKAAAGAILRELTISTVNWINHGFNGNPLYATDPGSALKSIRDQSIRNLNAIIGFDSKNYPFGQSVAQSLVAQIQGTFAQQAAYSLNQVIGQQYPGSTSADFSRDFSVGGWNALLAQTFLNNNPFGFRIITANELNRRIAGTAYSPAQDFRDQLARSGGFFDQRVCVDPNYNPDGVDQSLIADAAAANAADSAAADRAAVANAADAEAADYLAAHPGDASAQARLAAADAASAEANKRLADADQASADANAKLSTSNTKAKCGKWQIQTPGSVIAHALTKNLDTTNDQLINGQDLSADITAIFDALSNQLINKGLSSLSSNIPTNQPSSFSKNSNGIPETNQPIVVDASPNGTWMNQNSNFNVFTDIPRVMRYEDNSRNATALASGCTGSAGFNANNQFCAGDPTLPEGYQQILRKEVTAGAQTIASIYELDYCVPGPHPGWQDEIDAKASTFVSNPNLFPASASTSDIQKVLSTYGGTVGTTVGIVAGIAIGAAIGSSVPGLGTAIGAVVGAVVGVVLQAIGNNHNTTNEEAYGPIVNAVMGLDFEYKGDGKADLNGHDNSANIITTLAHRYKEAMQMVYAPNTSSLAAAESAAESNPDGTGINQSAATTTYTTGDTVKIPDLSTTNKVRAKIMGTSSDAFSMISDLISLDNTEFQKIDPLKQSVTQNQALLDTSISIEKQLKRLLDRIDNLPNLAGYPGVSGTLDLVPTISLTGSKIVVVNQGTTYIDKGATATDKTDGDISSRITVVNNVDTSTPGVYTITYDVTNHAGIAANQVTRSVRVIGIDGNVGDTVANPAVKATALENSTDAPITDTNTATDILNSDANTSAATETTSTRDYNKDLQAIKNIKDVSNLTDYEVELRRISNVFNQLAPYIHGADDLNKEEAVLDTMINESSSIAIPANGLPKSGALAECIDAMTNPKSQYLKVGGPTARVAFSFVTSTSGTIGKLPDWLLAKLPSSQSFLPEWHFAQGEGVKLYGKNWFPNDGEADYPPGIKDTPFFFPNYHGHDMKLASGTMGIETNGAVTLDDNKLIRNDDIGVINLQPINNAVKGLEHIVGMY